MRLRSRGSTASRPWLGPAMERLGSTTDSWCSSTAAPASWRADVGSASHAPTLNRDYRQWRVWALVGAREGWQRRDHADGQRRGELALPFPRGTSTTG